MNRPIGVAIVGILAFLRGLVALLGGLRLSGAGSYLLVGGFYGASVSYGFWGYIAVLLGIGILVIAYGLWNMQPWAWKWAIGLLILGLAIDVIFFIVEGQLNWLSALVGLIVLVYLAIPSTRRIYLT